MATTPDDGSKRADDSNDERAKTLLARGSHALYENLSGKLEPALGRALPQMNVRFSNLSLSADVVVLEDDKSELPSVLKTFRKHFTTTKKHSVRKEILKNVSGVFKPGTMTLLLGQPGSGKSALLKLLSGRFPTAKNITVEGDISYNGVAQHQIITTLPQFVAYVDQRDKHYASLTVKETLQFAHAFTGGELVRRSEELLSHGTPEENAEAQAAVTALFEHYPDIVIQQLGLESCQDTVVGNAMLRGVSGGERKRVTTGEMAFGLKYATFLDEISTGLDSAATFDIVRTERSVAQLLHTTVVIALLQPTPEVFALFDNVLLLNDGHVMYHGPREDVVAYFEHLGFVCPPHRDVADYLLDLGTSQQDAYTSALPLGGAASPHPRLASEFAALFRQSPVHAETMRALETPPAPDLLATVALHMDPTPAFHQSFWSNTRVLTRRQLLVTRRNTAFLQSRGVMVVVMALLYASTFFDVDPANMQVALGVMFQTIHFLALGQMAQVPTYMAARDVFYKHRRANFVRSAAYVVASVVSQLPIALSESFVVGSLVYWLCGFVASASAFAVFMTLLVLTHMALAAWFFFVAALAPDLHIAKPLSLLSIFFFMLSGGFAVAKSRMPDYFVWIYWLNPIAWCLRAVAVNQYRSPEFDECEYDGVDYCARFGKHMGQYQLSLYDVPDDKNWVWLGMLYLVAAAGVFMLLACVTLEYKRYESPEHTSVKTTTKAAAVDSSYQLVSTPKSSASTSEKAAVAIPVSSDRTTFVPVALAFKDLWYTVPLPSNPKRETIDLLKGISGYALPGTMTALMGSSGAGKTTLLDVIAGRKTGGTIQGEILLNGYAATDLAIRRCTGYCEQMDIHSEASTIREALTFSAFLRQDASVPASVKYDSVNECLELLDLHAIADQIIRGSSVEQMKRLTIGVELAAQPSVLFLDEPTSGLDARSAKLVMTGVRNVADTGRTVVCTIHQPSAEVFYLFDRLLLLKRGGETVFFGDLGERGRSLVNYFESLPGVAPLPDGSNPATWMLECIGAGVGNAPVAADSVDFVGSFTTSAYKRRLDDEMATPGVGSAAPDTSALLFTQKRAASSMVQLRFVVRRFLDLYWRTPSYNFARFVTSVFLALLLGVIFVGAEYATYQGVNTGVGMLFVATFANSVMAINSVLPIACDERASFYRERASQTYNALWYFVGSTVAEVPYVLVSGLLFTAVFFPMVGFSGVGTFVLYWLTLSLLLLLSAYMGQFLAFALPSVEIAAILSVLLNSVCFIFMGFNPPADAIPSGYRWLYAVTPQRYPLAVLAALVFADCSELPTWNNVASAFEGGGAELGCRSVANAPVGIGHVTVKAYVERVFHMTHAEIGSNLGYTLIAIVVFRVLALLSLRFISHQKR